MSATRHRVELVVTGQGTGGIPDPEVGENTIGPKYVEVSKHQDGDSDPTVALLVAADGQEHGQAVRAGQEAIE